MGDVPAIEEIAALLDQCKPEELNEILASIEGAGGAVPELTQQPKAPVPPPAPPPGNSRRPVRPGMKPVEGLSGAPPPPAAPTSPSGGGGNVIGMEEIKRILEEHSADVMLEVRKMIPSISTGAMEGIDIGTLTQALSERDQEVKNLEARLSALHMDLSSKDKMVMELGQELDTTMREVRHRQLDLEFQQLKLEEKVRNNAELEQAQRVLTARVEEASLTARHAALEADMSQQYTPRGTMRAQGSLPWTLRKNRLPAVSNGIAEIK
eukprot:TRINITY_DN60632_c0_g1_i1.p1 TRINITY_DN60632_c0_g1~~TRINITY_DN60632_c0_g1_i1.p1  ORF type:complete len:266 (+),score=75.27 TRINITY_DN60632_c0_g1_i1:98-895(+)